MNRALAETSTVLDRQRARVKWQQESYFSELSGVFSTQTSTHVHGFQGDLISDESVLDDLVVPRQVKPDPSLETSWPELEKVDMAGMGFGPYGYNNGPNFDMNYAISRTFSCPPAVAATIAKEAMEVKGKESIVSENMGSAVAREISKKRKADKLHNSKVHVLLCLHLSCFIQNVLFWDLVSCVKEPKFGKNQAKNHLMELVFFDMYVGCCG